MVRFYARRVTFIYFYHFLFFYHSLPYRAFFKIVTNTQMEDLWMIIYMSYNLHVKLNCLIMLYNIKATDKLLSSLKVPQLYRIFFFNRIHRIFLSSPLHCLLKYFTLSGWSLDWFPFWTGKLSRPKESVWSSFRLCYSQVEIVWRSYLSLSLDQPCNYSYISFDNLHQ